MSDIKEVSIKKLKGIGDKTSVPLSRLNINSVYDLLNYYPRDYSTYNPIKEVKDAKDGEKIALYLTIFQPASLIKTSKMNIIKAVGFDNTGKVDITFFRQDYLTRVLKKNTMKVFYGKVTVKGTSVKMDAPEIYDYNDYINLTKNLNPIYSLTKSVTNRALIKYVHEALNEFIPLDETLDEGILNKTKLISYNDAIKLIHFPKDYSDVRIARNRLAFEEFLEFFREINEKKKELLDKKSDLSIIETAEVSRFIEKLPFELTCGQKSAINDITSDLTSGIVMNRLIQGDVGSGKTLVSLIAILTVASNGLSSALMAPTEVLANQHYKTIEDYNERYNLGLRIALLTGSVSAKNKREIKEKAAIGEYNLIIGTHALIEDDVIIKDLALTVTDEMHRFGVNQREKLSDKGKNIHNLIMSATPIPRSLAQALYANLNVSIIPDKPANRLAIKNAVLLKEDRAKAYSVINKELSSGHQAYVICPMALENEDETSLKDVVTYSKELQEIFGNKYNIQYLHGQLSAKDKDKIMNDFKDGNIDILVSTTVIEVGIDVPNATVIMIENAERFGLSQLHQIRGRVGRGDAQSYCMFINCNPTDESIERLDVVYHSNDGFHIANEDLRLRGPGDVLGVRQSGVMLFKIADIYTDSKMLFLAKQIADEEMN